MIFYNNFLSNTKHFSKQNSKLRSHSKPDRNQSKLRVCTALIRHRKALDEKILKPIFSSVEYELSENFDKKCKGTIGMPNFCINK